MCKKKNKKKGQWLNENPLAKMIAKKKKKYKK